ncbi:MAG: PilZ domain-containing protein [Terriglobales bacterium]
MEKSCTRVISPHGASIVLPQTLVPEQEIRIRIASKHREFVARVVGQIGVESEGNIYGVASLDPQPNLWGICFPPAPDAGTGLAALVLRCAACSTRSAVQLNDIEVDVLRRSESLSRYCHRCKQGTLWKQQPDCGTAECAPEMAPETGTPSAPQRPETLPAAGKAPENHRKKPRVKVRMSGCVISPASNEDIVAVTDVSTDGLRFVSKQKYSTGLWVRIAAPYTAGTTNIFMEARVVWATLRNEIPNEYGLKYIKPR